MLIRRRRNFKTFKVFFRCQLAICTINFMTIWGDCLWVLQYPPPPHLLYNIIYFTKVSLHSQTDVSGLELCVFYINYFIISSNDKWRIESLIRTLTWRNMYIRQGRITGLSNYWQMQSIYNMVGILCKHKHRYMVAYYLINNIRKYTIGIREKKQ